MYETTAPATARPGRHDAPPPGCGPSLLAPDADAKPLRQKIFEYVRATGSTSRAEIARALAISAASVTALTADLLEQNMLREVEGSRAPEAGRGRPPTALEVVAEAHLVIGIKLSSERHSAVLADFAGNILADAVLPATGLARTVDALAADVEALVTRILDGRAPAQIQVVGIGLPGLIDAATGTVPWSPLLKSGPTPLAGLLAARLGLPVQIDNDVNMLTLAELWFGAGRAMTDFAVVTIENGVGMGLVIGNRLYRGTHGMGMEIGHAKVQLDGALCRCGKRGCLEAYVADYALTREAATALGQPDCSPQEMLDTLFAEAKAGNQAAQTIFRRAGRYLSLGLSNVIQLFDPALIILSGARMQYDYLYADEVMAEIQSLSLSGNRPPCKVEIHAWGDMVWARGASALALQALTDGLMA